MIGPLASQAPRPKSLPSRSVRRNGSLVQPPPAGTVSICELKAKQGPVAVVDAADHICAAFREGTNLCRETDGLELGRKKRGGLRLASRRILGVDSDEPLKQAEQGERYPAREQSSQSSLHFPSRRDLVERFDPALPRGVDPVVQVGHHAGVVGNDGDELADFGLFRARRRAHMPVLFAKPIDLPVQMIEDAAVALQSEQIRRQGSSIRRR